MTGECIRMDCGQHLGETSTQIEPRRASATLNVALSIEL